MCNKDHLVSSSSSRSRTPTKGVSFHGGILVSTVSGPIVVANNSTDRLRSKDVSIRRRES